MVDYVRGKITLARAPAKISLVVLWLRSVMTSNDGQSARKYPKADKRLA
jgi:hypothetical protein